MRARDFSMGGEQGSRNHLREGTYVNRLVKRNGVWMFSQVHFYLNMATDFDKGWGKDAQPIATVSTDIPPEPAAEHRCSRPYPRPSTCRGTIRTRSRVEVG